MLNIGSKIPKIASVQKSIENFMHSSVIMQWDNISKTILILAMGGLDFFSLDTVAYLFLSFV